jgi:hypothetical protein
MAVDFTLAVDSAMSVIECKKLLIRELELEVSTQHPDLWLVNGGTTVIVRDVADLFSKGRMETEIFGFRPQLVIGMRPVLSGPYAEEGVQTMMRAVDLMLRVTDGDLGFSVECERVLILRRDGRLYVRSDFESFFHDKDLKMISLPFERKALRP